MSGLYIHLKMIYKNRAKHGLFSWLQLINLVEAFDRDPRELLWEAFSHQGVPQKLVSLLKAMHKSIKVKLAVNGIEQVIGAIICVKHGNVLGPDLSEVLYGNGYEFMELLLLLQHVRSPMQSKVSTHRTSAADEKRFGNRRLRH